MPDSLPADSLRTNGIPMWLLAELTYACPLQCPYCSNPLELSATRKNELSTLEWLDVMQQARKLGAVQLGFSGGEPLVRPDLLELMTAATELGFYCNLITSAVGLDEKKIGQFKQAGLRHIQISFQGSEPESNQFFGGTDSFEHKFAMAKAVIAADIALGLNFVLHRHNLDQIEAFLQQAHAIGAEFVELANSQYYGWALHNRDQLMPTRHQVEEALRVTNAFKARHPDMNVFFVTPDYFEERPKKCSNGWGTTFLTVNPNGEVLPCQGAKVIPNIEFPNVREHSLKSIWQESDLFNRFRGTNWMTEPCRSCPEKEQDLGGCRCQAYMLTQDAYTADPVCGKSPHHHIITDAVAKAGQQLSRDGLVFRNPRNARSIKEQTLKNKLIKSQQVGA